MKSPHEYWDNHHFKFEEWKLRKSSTTKGETNNENV